MRWAYAADQIRAAEAPLLAALPDGVLMERAARGLAHAVAGFLGSTYGRRVLLVVGSGNNGGDALFAGAWLAGRGAAVEAVCLGTPHPAGLAALRRAGGRVVEASSARWPEVVVDGVVGIGGSGPLRPAAAAVFEAYAGVPVVAVDVPSGVDADTGEIAGAHVRAEVTVTFGGLKPAHVVDPGAAACGVVEVIDIGLELEDGPVAALEARDVALLIEPPAGDAHKYSRGVVGLCTGSARYPGAALLSLAGANCGLAGMVRYAGSAAPELVLAAHPEVVMGAGQVQAWVVGSGGGEEAAAALAACVAVGVPVVVDADALAEVTGPLPVPAVLTPHAGELARMLEVSRAEVEGAGLRYARLAAERYRAVVLLKGRRTLIAAPGAATWVNTTGVPWLATAGAGDVLAGLIGALLASGLAPQEAAAAGAWLHGQAATLAAEGGVRPITASDVARALPAACANAVRS